jgi:choline dehydrogenase
MKGQSEKFDSRIDWDVEVELPADGSMHVAQARVVGGGSSINGGTALRNSVKDCEEWLALGNDAWGWDSVELVYNDLEKSGHPIARMEVVDAGNIQRAFVAGAIESGLPWVDNLNATGAEGTGASPVCREGERRVSAANTFIDPIRRQRNFRIMPNALVDRIIFSGRKATGVRLVDQRHFNASGEVILAAGAIFSPAILQRSGVGPSALLQSLSIPVLQDLPVGQNLADHPCVPVVARPKPDAYLDTDFSLQMQARWSSTSNKRAIDLQMVCFSYLFISPSAAQPVASSRPQRSLGGSETGHVAGIGCNVNKPTSYGSVHIQSRDANEQPIVQPNYLTTAVDRARARENVRLAHKIMLSRPMQERLSAPLGLTADIVDSDESLDKWIKTQYSSTYHFTTSCRMAARELGGVVDQSGRVYGVDKLRIADASVIPTIPAANTMWTTMMFAQRIGCSVRDGVAVCIMGQKKSQGELSRL